MATRGITRSGLMYEPIVWNADGDFTGFYIDFKHPLTPFSSGMLVESIIAHDSEQLPITGFSKVSAGVYRIECNISGKVSGITVLNKVTSLLSFTTGRRLPPFSVHFYVAGIVPYTRMKYLYENFDIGVVLNYDSATESVLIAETTDIAMMPEKEEAFFGDLVCASGTIETVSVTLI